MEQINVTPEHLADRNFLASLEQAVKHTASTVDNPAWKRMYFTLADAIDCLDAFVVREKVRFKPMD